MNTNPFSATYAEDISLQKIRDIYVDDFVDIRSVMNHSHHFIWGSRGSGKSMLMKYIEARCQTNTIDELKNQDFTDCPVVPISIRFGYCEFRSPDFEAIEVNYAATLTEHKLIMSIARQVINKIKCFGDIDKSKLIRYSKSVLRECFGPGVRSAVDIANSFFSVEEAPLDWIDYIFKTELDFVRDYIKNKPKNLSPEYLECVTGYEECLIPFLRLTKELFEIDELVFYILIDDAGRTHEFQQEVINSWLARRDHDIVSIKLTAVRAEYTTFDSRGGYPIQPIHDYIETYLDVVYCNKDDYKEKLKDVVIKRFKACGLQIENVESFYPMDKSIKDIIEVERDKLRKEYNERNSTSKEKFSDYCSRRLMPRVFQAISEKKKTPIYSGFEMVVAVSSGIIRNFLAVSARMYNATTPDTDGVVREIKPEDQHRILSNYSKEFYESIRKSPVGKPEESDLMADLENLIKAIGKLCRERLLRKDITEGRIFSFTITQSEKLSKREKRVLQLAEQKSYLQKSFYTGKDSKSILEWYLLSRSLAPFFRLDPTALKGRMTFSFDDISFAIENPEGFVKAKIRNMKIENINVMENQMSMFESDEDLLYEEDFGNE